MSQLERCQKALNDFLEEKRNKFPRFYFLGDDDMLEILGQSQNPLIIQLHLKKLFSGIHTVKFTDSKDKILSMMSHLKEEVRLTEDIEVT
jgi:dynein heavy chain 2